MKLSRAQFIFTDKDGRDTRVTFEGDEVEVVGANRVTLDNKPRTWGGRPYKPCISHATEAIRTALGEPAKNNFETRRRNETRPSTRLVRYPKN
jgi:hypothetical protein